MRSASTTREPRIPDLTPHQEGRTVRARRALVLGTDIRLAPAEGGRIVSLLEFSNGIVRGVVCVERTFGIMNPFFDQSKLRAELAAPFPLSEGDIAQFRAEGFVKLRKVLSPELLRHYGEAITRQVVALTGTVKPMSQRTTYERAFLQVMNLWTRDEVCREFSFSKRLARIAAELMGVEGVRIYHDQALYKEPGGGITPWHADQYYWPLSNDHTCTVWIPFQPTPLEMGPLAFAARSQRFEYGRNLEISDESEKELQRALGDRNFTLVEEPFELGDVSYHYGWTFHRAGANSSDKPRAVMTMIYMEDGIRLIKPRNQHQQRDWATWLPGCMIGEVAASKLNPVIWSRQP